MVFEKGIDIILVVVHPRRFMGGFLTSFMTLVLEGKLLIYELLIDLWIENAEYLLLLG